MFNYKLTLAFVKETFNSIYPLPLTRSLYLAFTKGRRLTAGSICELHQRSTRFTLLRSGLVLPFKTIRTMSFSAKPMSVKSIIILV
jgi:hypothetical protein